LADIKRSINRDVIQETQIVKLENIKDTNDAKLDIEKIREIRLALRRRYANRTNFRKLFKDWDKNSNGEINLYEAKDMINKFGIAVNFNETRALINSSNQRGTDSLNLEEFMHLIFSNNEALEINNFNCI